MSLWNILDIPRRNQFEPNGIFITTEYSTVLKARTDYMFCAGFFHARKKFFKVFSILVTLSPTFNAVYMKPSELQEKTCHQFDCAIKTVIRHRAIDFYRAIRRSEKKEMPFAEIMDDLLNSIGTEDTYSTDYVAVFEVCGEKVSIEDEQLARALKAIEERKRNIVLQYFFIGDTDTYIGKMLDCSRANVTKCRIQALDKLKQLIEEEKEKCQKS